MRIKSLFMAFLAGALALVACKQEQNPNDLPPSITVTPSEVSFEQSEGSQKLAVNATRAWTVSGIPEWIAVTPTSGEASLNASDVIVSVLSNTGNDREATITFSIGLAKQAVTVKQKGAKGEVDNGKGTKDSPYTVAGVVAYVQALGQDVESPEKVYVKGKISVVGTTFEASGNYGNATFDMVDPEGGDAVFKAFQTYYLGNRKWKAGDTDVKEGDDVIIYGTVYNFKGNTPETTGKGTSFIYSLNGVTDGGDEPGTGGDPKGSGTVDDPFNVAAAINAVKDLTWTANDNYQKVGPFYVKGKVSNVKEQFAAQFGNATFDMVDEGTTATFTAYRILYLGNKKWTSGDKELKEGDEVIVYAELMNYRGNTPETVQNSGYLYSLNGETGGTPGPGPGGDQAEAKGDGSQANPYNVSAAINAVKNLTWTANDNYQKVGPFYVKGKVASVKEQFAAQFGNATFDIVDEGFSATFTAYRILYLGNKKWTSGDKELKEGDEVVVYGELMNYRGNTPETVQNSAYLYSLNGDTGGDDPGPGPGPDPGTPSGDGSVGNPYNVAAAIDAVKNLTWTNKDTYEKVGPYYVKGKISNVKEQYGSQFGNATFEMVDEGSAAVFTAYRILYFNNEKWVDGNMTVAVGDDVVVYAELMNYHGDTPETVQNSGWLYSLNGVTGDDPGPGPGPGPDPGTPEGDGSLDNPYNSWAAIEAVKDLTWTSNTEYEKTDVVYVKGKISRIASKGTYTESGEYGNASFWISPDGSENGEFQVFRALYLGNKKYTTGIDIGKGDDVIICGKLMNYKGNTPETVANEAYLYSLNGSTEGDDPGPGPGPGPGGDGEVTLDASQLAALADKGATNTLSPEVTLTNSSDYGTTSVAQLRVYKKQTLTIKAADNYKITGIEMVCTAKDDAQYGPGCWGAGAPSGYSYSGDTGTWSGTAQSVSFTATDNQVRIKELKVYFTAD